MEQIELDRLLKQYYDLESLIYDNVLKIGTTITYPDRTDTELLEFEIVDVQVQRHPQIYCIKSVRGTLQMWVSPRLVKPK